MTSNFTDDARSTRAVARAWSAPMSRLSIFFIGLIMLLGPVSAQEKTLTIFAAASMKNALDEVNTLYTARTGVRCIVSYAASSVLARQIDKGAPADAFVSADGEWMEYAIARGAINESSRVNLLGNSLVLIAPRDSKIEGVAVVSGMNFANLLGDGRIAIGDVRSVPAGKYARDALVKLGAWQPVESKFAMAESVRAALALVARGEAALGIVYATDAKVEPGVKVIGTFPAESHPPIIYPVAATLHAKAGAADYLGFLRSASAKTVFEKYGFKVLARPAS
jgi:molybdate transport system substrate-binding protein